MASAERKPITGIWGGAPNGRPEAEPPVGVRGASPLKLNAFFIFFVQMKPQICHMIDI